MAAEKKIKTAKDLKYRRIIVKLGTSLLTGGTDQLNPAMISRLVDQMAQLHRLGAEIVVVSSGAIAAGRYKLGLGKESHGIPFKQVLASVGQGRLMNIYDQLFGWYDITVAQALLTRSDLCDRAGYLNARNTLMALMELKVICVVNENDVVAVDEIKETKFGDNDNLSAMVANLVDADLLVMLTDIAGLYTDDPRRNPDARLIQRVDFVESDVDTLLCDIPGEQGTGGMATKIEAARLATASGAKVIIADGREPDIIMRLASGEEIGTQFRPAVSKLESRQRWMMSGLSTRGRLVLDSGAALALRKQHRSLLAAGIVDVEGDFERGDIVNLYDAGGVRLGCGITNYGSEEVSSIKGTNSKKIADVLGYDYGTEVVHRNNLVVFRL